MKRDVSRLLVEPVVVELGGLVVRQVDAVDERGLEQLGAQVAGVNGAEGALRSLEQGPRTWWRVHK